MDESMDQLSNAFEEPDYQIIPEVRNHVELTPLKTAKELMEIFEDMLNRLETSISKGSEKKWVDLMEKFALLFEKNARQMRKCIDTQKGKKFFDLMIQIMAMILKPQDPKTQFLNQKMKNWLNASIMKPHSLQFSSFLNCCYYLGKFLQLYNREQILQYFFPKLQVSFLKEDWRWRSAAILVASQINHKSLDRVFNLFVRAGSDQNLIVRSSAAYALGSLLNREKYMRSQRLQKILPLYEKNLSHEYQIITAHWMVFLTDPMMDLVESISIVKTILERIRFFIQEGTGYIRICGAYTLVLLFKRKCLLDNIQIKQNLEFCLVMLKKSEQDSSEELFRWLIDACSICVEINPAIGHAYIEQLVQFLATAMKMKPPPGSLPQRYKKAQVKIENVCDWWARICSKGKPFENWERTFADLLKNAFGQIKLGRNRFGILWITKTAECFKSKFRRFVPKIFDFFNDRIQLGQPDMDPIEAIECIKKVMIEVKPIEIQIIRNNINFISVMEEEFFHQEKFKTFNIFVKNQNELFQIFHEILEESCIHHFYEKKKEFLQSLLRKITSTVNSQVNKNIEIQQLKHCVEELINSLLIFISVQKKQKQITLSYLVSKALELQKIESWPSIQIFISISTKIFQNFKYEQIVIYMGEFERIIRNFSVNKHAIIRKSALEVFASFIEFIPYNVRIKQLVLKWMETVKNSYRIPKTDAKETNYERARSKCFQVIEKIIDKWLDCFPFEQKEGNNNVELLFLSEIIQSKSLTIFPKANSKFQLSRIQKIMRVIADAAINNFQSQSDQFKDKQMQKKLAEMCQNISKWEMYKDHKEEIESKLNHKEISCLSELMAFKCD